MEDVIAAHLRGKKHLPSVLHLQTFKSRHILADDLPVIFDFIILFYINVIANIML